jgi:hypothetical protein
MLGMTQDEFGRRVGPVSGTTVGNWEAARNQPDFDTVDRIYGLCGDRNLHHVPPIYHPPNPFT